MKISTEMMALEKEALTDLAEEEGKKLARYFEDCPICGDPELEGRSAMAWMFEDKQGRLFFNCELDCGSDKRPVLEAIYQKIMEVI